MKTLPTWSQRSTFSYAGFREYRHHDFLWIGLPRLCHHWTVLSLLEQFRGMTVDVWASRTGPPARSVGEWLQANVTKTAIASYVCPIFFMMKVLRRRSVNHRSHSQQIQIGKAQVAQASTNRQRDTHDNVGGEIKKYRQ